MGIVTTLRLAPLLAMGLLFSQQPAMASTTTVEPFAKGSLSGWQEREFAGQTDYALKDYQGTQVLQAKANGTASVLFKRETINVQDRPWLEWSWKIESIYDGINEQSKAGDDFPARLYVTAQTGLLPWESVAINYVWSSTQETGDVWENPYTSKSIMVAVEAGTDRVGDWVAHRRNVIADFKQLFDIDVKHISGYAVMVDGDNSANSGTAYFGKIAFKKQ